MGVGVYGAIGFPYRLTPAEVAYINVFASQESRHIYSAILSVRGKCIEDCSTLHNNLLLSRDIHV